MAHPLCLRCMRYATSASNPNIPASGIIRAGFSTTTFLNKQAPAVKGKKTLRLAKNKRVKTTKPPAPGERRAFKKKIVLSNPNAVDIAELEDISADKLSLRNTPNTTTNSPSVQSTVLKGYEGHVLGLKDDAAQALMALDVFRPSQSWRMFHRPATVIRSQTVDLADMLGQAEKQKTARKMILTGPRGSGKSVILLQAAAMAYEKGWVVIHIPESKDLVNAHTSYRPLLAADGTQTYIQPHYVSQLLRKILRANQEVLSKMQLSQEHKLPLPIQSNMSLARLAELGRDIELAWPVWQAFWAELTTPSDSAKDGQKRPPILFSMDDLNNVMRSTAYLTPEMQSIHAHDLAIVKHFNDLLGGKSPTPNGSLTLGATTRSNGLAAPTMEFILNRNSAISPLSWDPYMAIDDRVVNVLETVEVKRVEGLSKSEAKGVIEYYASCGLLMNAVTDTFVGEKWSVSGGGIVGMLEKATISPLL